MPLWTAKGLRGFPDNFSNEVRTASTILGSASTSSPAVRAGQVVYPPSACCSGGGMYPAAPLANSILKVDWNGLRALSFNPVMA